MFYLDESFLRNILPYEQTLYRLATSANKVCASGKSDQSETEFRWRPHTFLAAMSKKRYVGSPCPMLGQTLFARFANERSEFQTRCWINVWSFSLGFKWT